MIARQAGSSGSSISLDNRFDQLRLVRSIPARRRLRFSFSLSSRGVNYLRVSQPGAGAVASPIPAEAIAASPVLSTGKVGIGRVAAIAVQARSSGG